MLRAVTAALAAKSVLVAAAVIETDRWAALVALSALPLIALLVSPALLLHGRARTAYLVGADVLVTTLLLADLLNARASGRLLSLHMIAAAPSFDGLGSSVFAMARWYDVVLVADLLGLLALAASARWRRTHPKKEHSRPRPRTAALVAGGAALAFAVQALAQTSDPGLRVVALSPLGAHAHEAYDELVDTNRALTPHERERVADWFDGTAAYQQKVAPEHADLVGLLEGRDVYLVQFESLEEVVLGAAPFGQEVTPTLNDWLGESLVFDHVVEQVRDGTSSDAELLMIAGVYPLRSGAAFMRFPDNAGYTSLPRLLRGDGFHPIALHGDVATFWNRDRVFPRLGYERYVAEKDFVSRTELGMGLADKDLFDQALRELDRVPSPRFLHLITTTSHTPWHLPEGMQGLELPADDATSRYLQTVHYTDARLGEFARGLEERGLLEDSAIVVVGDHQGPHRYVPEDELWLADNEGRVPFVVYVPGLDGRRISTPGGQVDVLPTLAQLLGIPAERYAGSVMGRTLLGPHSGSAVRSDGQVLPGADGSELLAEAYAVADLAVTGDWFTRPR